MYPYHAKLTLDFMCVLYQKKIESNNLLSSKKTNIKYKNLGEKVLSVKNYYSNNKKYKVFTLCSIRMKFKIKK